MNARRSLAAEAMAVFRKDVRSELRTRSALYAIGLFSLTSLVVISFTVVTEGNGLTLDANLRVGDTGTRQVLLAALLWVVLFFSALAGLARTFVKEEERRTVAALRLAARPLAVYFGKLGFNMALQTALGGLVTPLFILFFHPSVGSPLLLTVVVVLGCASMGAATTILSAIVARAGGSSALFAALGFPVLLFVLILAINSTAGALAGGEAALLARNQLPALVSYLVMMVTVSAMVFEHVWQA